MTNQRIIQFGGHPISYTEIEIKPYIIVDKRLCEIITCECNPTNKRICIRCKDVETNKVYGIFVKNSLFLLEKFEKEDTSTIVDYTLEHISEHYYEFRQKRKSDLPNEINPDGVTIYTASGSHIIMGCYLKHASDYYLISDYKINNGIVSIDCSHIYTKQNITYEILPISEENKIFKEPNITELGSAIVYNDRNYICCHDNCNNTIGFALKGMK